MDGDKSVTADFVSTPAIPVLASPVHNSLTTQYTPLFKWSNTALYLSRYHFQLALDSGFTSIVHENTNVLVPELQLPVTLDPNTKYYWRVQSFNVLDQTKGWSTTFAVRTAITSPVLLTPEIGWMGNTPRPTFDWQDVDGATSYTIQIGYNSTFTSLAISTTASSSQYTASKDLAKNRVMYWRVRANGTNGPSLWSEVWQFTTANTPSTPGLGSPANNGLVTSLTPRLDWTNSTVPAGTTFERYELQVALDNAFSSGLIEKVISGDVTASEYTFTENLNPNTRYFWRVRATNAAGQTSTWSAVRYFRSAMLNPVSLSPEIGWMGNTPRPTFDWQDVDGATSYTIQIGYNNTFTSLAISTTASSSQYTASKDLAKNRVMYWRVRANGTNGPSLWSEVWQFTTANTPSTPGLGSPANNGLVTSLSPRLDWTNSTVPTGTTFERYELQVALDNAFSSGLIEKVIAGDVTASEYTFTENLNPNTRYFWRVRSFNSAGHYSTWSVTRYFRSAMLPPELLTPTTGWSAVTSEQSPDVQQATITSWVADSPRPTFDWQDVDGATSYTIQIGYNSTFSSLAISTTCQQFTIHRQQRPGEEPGHVLAGTGEWHKWTQPVVGSMAVHNRKHTQHTRFGQSSQQWLGDEPDPPPGLDEFHGACRDNI